MVDSPSKLLYSATMSLDGFIAGPGGDMSWLTDLLMRSSHEVDDLIAAYAPWIALEVAASREGWVCLAGQKTVAGAS